MIETAGSQQSEKIRIERSGAKGLGTFARAPIAAGELILVTGGDVITTAQLKDVALREHPFQIETDLLLAPPGAELAGIFAVNHSCSPNAGLRGQLSLVAMRDIKEGEEICYDYVTTDSDPGGVETFRMHCLCETTDCRKTVTDRDWRLPALRKKYLGWFSSYLAARIAREQQ